MSDATTHLLLPYILAAQAQKHVTHNEALRLLDGLVQLSVLDRDLTAPPGSPADGDRYIVGSGATGDWAGWDLNVALWTDGAWMRLPSRTGWRAWVEDEGLLLVYDGAGWVGTTPSELQNMALLGVGTTADEGAALVGGGLPAIGRLRRNGRQNRVGLRCVPLRGHCGPAIDLGAEGRIVDPQMEGVEPIHELAHQRAHLVVIDP